MNRKSLISHIFKISFFIFISLAIFVLFVIIYSYYNNYLHNIEFLENKTIENYKLLTSKTNENITSRYFIDYKTSLQNKKNIIKNRSYLAYSLLQNIYFNKKNEFSIEEMKSYALNLLKFITFDNGKGYYNIFDSNGRAIYTPYSPKFVSDYIFNKIVQNIKTGKNNFYILYWQHPYKKGEPFKKIIHGIYFKQFDWVIITGFYTRDFKKKFNEDYLLKISNLKIPRNIGVVILNDKNKILLTFQCAQRNILPKIRTLNFEKGFGNIVFNNKHYTLFQDKIFINNWKVVTFFINENVKTYFAKNRKRLFHHFVIQLSVVIIIIFAAIILFLICFKDVKKKLEEQFDILIHFIKKVPQTYEKIDTDSLVFNEIYSIGKYSNEMVDTIQKLNYEKETAYNRAVQEKNFLNTIMSNMYQGLAVITTDFKIDYVNDFGLKLMKYSFDIIGKYLTNLVPTSFSQEDFILNKVFDEINKTKKPVKLPKVKLYRGDGSLIYAFLSVAPILSENKKSIDKYIIIFFDITDEVQLRREVMRLKRAIESSSVSVVITDIDANIQYVNPYFSELTGYSFKEALGVNPRILRTEYNKKLYKDLWDTITSGKVWKGEFLNKKKNGEEYWENAIIAPVLNEKGKIINYVAVKEDITERKKFIRQLETAKEKAEVANKVKSEFLANMSHEIRTPMNAIMGFIDLVLDTELKATQREYLEIVKDSTEKLLRIINDILDISKLDSAKFEFENRPFDLKKLINHCSNIFSSKISGKGLDFNIEIDEKISEYFIGDEVRIVQVINNLLNNAIKFTEKGSITLRCKLLSKNTEKALIQVSVSDTGVGIPEDRKEKIFEAFSQADGSITRRFGGTGLGLTIASKIVKEYNGKIWVESEEGKGSTFYFTIELPITEEIPESNIAEQEESLHFDDSSVNILVAEDNETNQILIKEVLKTMGISVTIAENGLEAIKALSQKDYDLILMDWHMPVMDGVEALEILRKIEKGESFDHNMLDKKVIENLKEKKFTVIALTAAALKSEKESLLSKGFNDYLSKPFKPAELSSILKKYTSGKKRVFKETKKIKIVTENSLDYIKELVGDNEELIKTLLDSFRDTFKKSLNDMEQAVVKSDFDGIQRAAHTLKGAAANIGFNEIAEVLITIENNVKTKHLENIKKLLSELHNFSI